MSQLPPTPETFAAAWGAEHLVRLPASDPARDRILLDTFRFLANAGLPRRMVLSGLFPEWEISFETLASRLVPILEAVECLGDPETAWPPEDVPGGGWENYFLLGEENFGVGDAVYCLHGPTGHVLRLDVEIPEPISLVNTSVARLAGSLLVLREWSRSCRRGEGEWPAELQRLEEELREADPAAMEDEAGWFGLVATLRDEGERAREFRVDPV